MKLKTLYTFAALFVLAAILAIAPGARGVVAQEPVSAGETIPYSGRLSNDAGQPVADGRYAFTFALHDAAQNGNLLWSETQTGVALKGGVFSVLLGSKTPIPKVARGSSGWLEISVRGPGESDFTELSPRMPLTTAATASPSSPAESPSCPHDHFGEAWTGNSKDTAANGGLFVQDYRLNGVGIEGWANNGLDAWGVNGESTNGFGVRGYSSTGFAMAADGDAAQSRDNGGWVKAMARVSGTNITRCYNSQATGGNISTPPCGFTSTGFVGNYTVDFGFQVDDRFISLTPEYGNPSSVSLKVQDYPTSNSVYIWLNPDSTFFIIVF